MQEISRNFCNFLFPCLFPFLSVSLLCQSLPLFSMGNYAQQSTVCYPRAGVAPATIWSLATLGLSVPSSQTVRGAPWHPAKPRCTQFSGRISKFKLAESNCDSDVNHQIKSLPSESVKSKLNTLCFA